MTKDTGLNPWKIETAHIFAIESSSKYEHIGLFNVYTPLLICTHFGHQIIGKILNAVLYEHSLL